MTTPGQDHEPPLDYLARVHGITTEYYDNWGRRHPTSDETKRALLEAMGLRVSTAEELAREAAAFEAGRWGTLCDPVLVVTEGAPSNTWSVRLPLEPGEDGAVRITWEVWDETGVRQRSDGAGPGLSAKEEAAVDGLRYARFELPIPSSLPLGYYTVRASAEASGHAAHGQLHLIVAPAACHVPASFRQGARVWGFSLQLYALRSSRNWGIGDLGDLDELVQWSAAVLGVGVIGLNPLHAMKNRHPYHISPYAPDSRFYLNPIYLDIERLGEYRESSAARRLLDEPTVKETLERVRRADSVDYGEVWALKQRVLRETFATFLERHYVEEGDGWQPRTERGRAFARYLEDEGVHLQRYATFQALSERFARADPPTWVWWNWPASLKNAESREVAAFQRMHPREVLFHAYLQWLADEQLARVAEGGRRAGMPVGLYLDLALGSERAGSDVWMFTGQFPEGADAGAPPDAFSQDGQNWGVPPMDPHRLRTDGYRTFIRLLRKSFRHAGALRIDHVMALFRLFWIPRGQPASAGAYVVYPVEDLLGILALESVRHQTLVIGEDLGTVPDHVRERLERAGVLSYRVLYFEREADGAFTAPGRYPAQAVGVVNTPDLPTLAGFWSGHDIDVRASLGLIANEDARRAAFEQRQADKRRLVQALKSERLWPASLSEEEALSGPLTTDLGLAVHAYLARAPSWIVLASLEDIVMDEEQPNLPGTLNEHPNWVRKRNPPLAELRRDFLVYRLAATMLLQRPRNVKGEK